MQRRIFLEHLLVAGAATGTGTVQGRSFCIPVSASTLASQPAPDNDLTRHYENGHQAIGQPITLEGRVLTAEGAAVNGAIVLLNQSCISGQCGYVSENHSNYCDPNFRHSGHAVTDGHGRYLFYTILPGPYPVAERSDPGLGFVSFRAPHIHLKVKRNGQELFSSPVFFDLFDDINKFDLMLYKKNREDQQRLLITHTEPSSAGDLVHFQVDIKI